MRPCFRAPHPNNVATYALLLWPTFKKHWKNRHEKRIFCTLQCSEDRRAACFELLLRACWVVSLGVFFATFLGVVCWKLVAARNNCKLGTSAFHYFRVQGMLVIGVFFFFFRRRTSYNPESRLGFWAYYILALKRYENKRFGASHGTRYNNWDFKRQSLPKNLKHNKNCVSAKAPACTSWVCLSCRGSSTKSLQHSCLAW